MRSDSLSPVDSTAGAGFQSPATSPTSQAGSPPQSKRKRSKETSPDLLAGLPLPTPGDSFASLQTTVYLEAQKLANHTDHLQQVLSANEYRRALSLIPGIIQTMRDLNFHLHQVEGMLDAGKGKGGRNVR